MATGTASATSLNFLGFEDMKGYGTPPLIFGQVFIQPNQAVTAGVNQISAAGYLPGQQSYLKRRQAIWSKSRIGRHLSMQGFRRVYGM